MSQYVLERSFKNRLTAQCSCTGPASWDCGMYPGGWCLAQRGSASQRSRPFCRW